MLVTVTVAPGTTPPPVSLTTPLSVARSTCASAAGTASRNTATKATMPCSNRFMKLLRGAGLHAGPMNCGSDSLHERQPRIGRGPRVPESCVSGIVGGRHRAPAASEDVQIVRVVPIGCHERMIAVAYGDYIAVRHAYGVVAPVSIDAMVPVAVRIAVPKVIDFVEI